MRSIKWTPVIAAMVIIALAMTLSYVGCGGSSSSNSGSSAPALKLGEVITASGLVTFNQNCTAADGTDGNGFYEVFPGQANYWDLNRDFTLTDGADDQFDGAMQLAVSGTLYAANQTYSELTWMSPAFGTGDGIKVAAAVTSAHRAPISGTYSALLNNLSDARLMQTINLSSAITPITLTWSYNYNIYSGIIPITDTTYFKLVVRDTAGNLLDTIYSDVITDSSNASASNAVTASLTAYAGQSIVLSFESRYTQNESGGSRGCLVDDISVKGNNGTEYVINGNFEAGNLNGWSTNSPSECRNVTSGARTLEGLTVTRSFFAAPNKSWGRWTDVFENNTLADISVVITYTTELGNDYYGIIYTPSGTSGRSITSWDGSSSDRDLGWVFGTSNALSFTSVTTLGGSDGSDLIYVTRNVTVTAGSRIAIVNFVIMNGIDTGLTASAITDKATAIDAEAANIVTKFWSDVQYREGMTQEQIDAVLNFPH